MANQSKKTVPLLEFKEDDSPTEKLTVISCFKNINDKNPEFSLYDNNSVYIERIVHHEVHNEFLNDNSRTVCLQ